ncbi:MAG: hypothetical protein ACRD9R_18070 [Pyrinomonadaceae bacterium]
MSNKRACTTFASAMALLAVYLWFFVPGVKADPEPREAKPIPAGEVVVILSEQTFNALSEAVFALERPLAYPLKRNSGERADCASELVPVREAEGVKTALRLRDGQISASLAFRGSYAAPLLGCLNFRGWADTTLALSFDRERQALLARVAVKNVQLKNVPSVLSDGVTRLVQDTIDARLNPIQILRAEQLSARLPLQKAGGPTTALRLRARDVRHEITQGELRLRIAYELVLED